MASARPSFRTSSWMAPMPPQEMACVLVAAS